MDTPGIPFADPFAPTRPDNVVQLRPPWPFPVYGPDQITAMPAAQADWICKGLVARGCVTELTGELKAGKTTFFAELARAMREGRPFLGQPTRWAHITWLTEQAPTTFLQALRRAHLEACDVGEVTVVFRQDAKKLPWPALIRACIDDDQRRGGGGVLVVDTLLRFVGVGPEQENDPAIAGRSMDPLLEAAKAGMAVQVHRHARKSGGDVASAGRGSSAWSQDVDVMLLLRRQPRADNGDEPSANTRCRVLESMSRFSETPGQDEPCTLTLTPDGYGIVAGDTAKQQRIDDLDEQILLYVAAHAGCSKRDIRQTSAIRGKATLRDDRVVALCTEGKLHEGLFERRDANGRTRSLPGFVIGPLA